MTDAIEQALEAAFLLRVYEDMEFPEGYKERIVAASYKMPVGTDATWDEVLQHIFNKYGV